MLQSRVTANVFYSPASLWEGCNYSKCETRSCKGMSAGPEQRAGYSFTWQARSSGEKAKTKNHSNVSRNELALAS